MKQEIKERLEKIRNGDVPEGYQKTKVGIIPDDWLVSLTDDVAKRGTGHTPNKKFPSYYNGGIKWISLRDSNKLDDGLIFNTKVEISEEGLSNSSAVLHSKGSVLISRDAGVGKSAIMGNDMSVSQHFITWTCSNKLNNWYLYYYLQKRKSEFERMAVGSTIKTIGMPFFKKYKISLPPINEQEKIAEILSTWDKAIELKEKLIEDKNKFKRGLMQNIISAQMNDKSSWEFAKFKDIFEIIKRPIDKNPEEDYKRLTVKRRLGGIQLRDIKKGKEILVDSQHIVKEGDFIISNKQVFHGAIGIVQKKFENSIVSIEYNILRCNEGFDTDFLFYCMYSSQFKKTIIERTQGVHEEKFVFLFNEWYKTLGIYVPSIDEQKSIVSVLNNMNENIRIVKNEVVQLKEQKRGLMQLLLTGIVRVEVD